MISLPGVPSDRPRIFISYARDDDEAFAKRLWLDLEKYGLSVWWDREAMESRGLSFLREIRDAITAAARVLLIVGPRVKHSPYVEMEWRHALREGVVVTPLLRLERFTLGLQTELGFQPEEPRFTCTACAQSESKPL